MYTDGKCKTKAGAPKTYDTTKYASFLDKCKSTKTSSTLMWCDTKGMHIDQFSTAGCKADKKIAVRSQTVKFGECYSQNKVSFVFKGAETLKMAISGAALALVASQF